MDQTLAGEQQIRSSGAARPTCTIVISTRDRPGSLARCLHAVRKQRYAGLELVVVDSAPALESAEKVAEGFGARCVLEDRTGLSRARNRGAREARGDVIVFLDDDVAVEDGCIGALVDEFTDPQTMLVTGRLLLADGDAEARAAFESFGGFDAGPSRRALDRSTPRWFELVNFGALGTGAMLAIRRSAFQGWSGFDVRLGRGAPLDGCEELYAYFSLVEQGHRLVYTPEAVARHPAPESMAALRQRILNGASSASAYMTLLLFEHPRYSARVMRYAWDALRGKRRDWRPRPATLRHLVVPRWRERIAWAIGPLFYLRMRLKVLAGNRHALARQTAECGGHNG